MLLDRLAEDLRLKPEYIELVARTASHRYKTYSIPKKNGGLRTIHHPARELKLMQSWLVEKVFARFPVHRAATAYKKGASILLNATRHKKNNYLLKVDFENFFPSITGPDIVQLFQKSTLAGTRRIFSLPEVEFIRQIVCRGDRLTIGAPSSPMISNIVMFEFDNNQAAYCHCIRPILFNECPTDSRDIIR
jgi:RNA-directed DNA polymerase